MGLFDRAKAINQRSGLSIVLDLAAAVTQRLREKDTKDHGPRIEAPKVVEEHGPAVFFKHSDHAMVVHAPEVVEAEILGEEESPDVVASFEEIERRRGITWGARLDEMVARRAYRLALDRVRRAEWAAKSRPAKFTYKTLQYWMDRGLCFRPAEKTGEIRNIKRRINFNPTTLKFLVRRTKQVQMIPPQRRPSADVYANWKWVGSKLVHMTDAEFFAHEMRLQQHEERERHARRYTPPKRGKKAKPTDHAAADQAALQAMAAELVAKESAVPAPAQKILSLPSRVTLQYLMEAMKSDDIHLNVDVLKVAFDLGLRSVTSTTEIDFEAAEIIVAEFGWTVMRAE